MQYQYSLEHWGNELGFPILKISFLHKLSEMLLFEWEFRVSKIAYMESVWGGLVFVYVADILALLIFYLGVHLAYNRRGIDEGSVRLLFFQGRMNFPLLIEKAD